MSQCPIQAVLIKTSKNKFRLTISFHRNRDTNVLETITMNLGGKHNKCVTISIPSANTAGTNGIIASIEKKSDCSFDTPADNSGFSQHMLLLGLTIARDLNPAVKRFYFDDCSHVECEMPDGKTIAISLRNLNIAFHGASWYEQYFDAKLVDNHAEYRKRMQNLYAPEKKPARFDFKNSQLTEELTPLYNSCSTWAEFFKAIRDKYKTKKCAIVFPWFMNALYLIFDGNMFDNMKWYIDVEENAISQIPFETYEAGVRGGGVRRNTRRRRQKTYAYTSFVMNPGEVMAYDYCAFLDG